MNDKPARRRRVVVPAAGIIAFRASGDGDEALVVHRPKYDDWVLPKGHVESGELLPETACREFKEETGYRATIVRPVARVDYPVGETIKRVHWYLGRLVATPPGDVANPEEVSQVQWLRVDEALAKLTYGNEREVMLRAAQLELSSPMLIVRHAKALGRKGWKKADPLRPLAAKGKRQAKQLIRLLTAYGVAGLVSSPSTRCLQTLQPYSAATGHEIAPIAGLSEEIAALDPGGVMDAMDSLAAFVWSREVPVAVCGHRPVLPLMVAAFAGVAEKYTTLKPAEVLVVHLGVQTGAVVATERYISKTH